ncbi:hypothetical protein [Nostoc sp. WHI]|uniref:hypothetical protein n=1 Tax=Nostoc sp. WHI TaxID=2650611 RepID=UPI0018C76E5B|nr:hypothetical protein [Nostoc sp. WHI]MBG1267769.1 hypothetical protein [Nostoc sp. WHI]
MNLVTDEQLCNVARDYILKEYAPAGHISYVWDECEDPLNDTTKAVVGECPPSDVVDYEWIQICSCEVIKAEVSERDDHAEEYTVTITAQIAIATDDEEDLDKVEPEEREIFCTIYKDTYSKDFYVADAEE